MQIIPVIDLLDGQVVHAKKGARQHYLPIQSQLTHSSQPLDIVTALLDYYPFTQLYIADLNAIQGCGSPHYKLITAIAECFPQLKLMLDAGIQHKQTLQFWPQHHVTVVLGSETFTHIDTFKALHLKPSDNYILSLDFMPSGYLGPQELLDHVHDWPQKIIVMALAHVGTNQGVNLPLLQEIIQRTPTNSDIYAAGGVRDMDDLMTLKNIGVKGALIATALHQKQISASQLASLCP